jgi:cob(I)alamin adenosyltransferase
MIRIDRVVTRGGDGGETSLGDGTRVAKDALRVEAFGAVDEANAAIGLLRLHAPDAETDAMLGRIQNDLFDVGADLCVPQPDAIDEARTRLRLTDAPCLRLEAELAAMRPAIAPLTSFILPGGTPPAAHAHFARTVVRRAERRVVRLGHTETLNPAVVRYLNRLSDFLFVLGRRLNENGARDVQWVPGKTR